MSAVLAPKEQVKVLYWGKLDVIKSVGFSKGIRMTEGIKGIAAGRQAVVVQAAAKVALWPQQAGAAQHTTAYCLS